MTTKSVPGLGNGFTRDYLASFFSMSKSIFAGNITAVPLRFKSKHLHGLIDMWNSEKTREEFKPQELSRPKHMQMRAWDRTQELE